MTRIVSNVGVASLAFSACGVSQWLTFLLIYVLSVAVNRWCRFVSSVTLTLQGEGVYTNGACALGPARRICDCRGLRRSRLRSAVGMHELHAFFLNIDEICAFVRPPR